MDQGMTAFEAYSLLLGAFLCVMAIVNIWNYRHQRNGDWHPYGLDGMRRFWRGGWQYRPMTSTEAADDQGDLAT
jgi:hypothetical protein